MSLRWSRYLPMYRANPQGTPQALAVLREHVEAAIPGARWRVARGAYEVDCIDVPLHGATLLGQWAQGIEGMQGFQWTTCKAPPELRRMPLDERRADATIKPFPWQVGAADALEGAARLLGYRGIGLNVACGGGKTLITLELLRRFLGPVLIVGPAKSRSAWEGDIRAYLDVQPHVMYPRAERRESDLTLREYLAECHGLPAVKGVNDRWSRIAVRVHGVELSSPAVQHALKQLQRMGRVVDAAELQGDRIEGPRGVDAYVRIEGADTDPLPLPAGLPTFRVRVPTPQRPWVIAGNEVLADVLREIRDANFHPALLAWDEWHTIVEPGIWGMEARQVGGDCPGCGAKGAEGAIPAAECVSGCPGGKFYMHGTSASKAGTLLQPREIRSAAAFMLATMESVQLRIGDTATIPVAAKQENMFMPLSLLHPYCWGKKRNFQVAYASGRVAEASHARAGYWVTGPNSNVDALRGRCEGFMVKVPVEVSHADVLPLKVQISWLSPSVQAKRPVLAREEGAVARPGKQQAQAMAREGRKLRGLAAVRSVAVRNACEVLEAGHKVVVFTTRLAEAALLQEAVYKAMPKGAFSVLADGSVPTREREALRDQWLAYPGPAALVATGYAWATSANGLQKAIKIIQTGLPDDVVHQLQWIGRGHRHGSICGTYEILIGEGTYYEDAARGLEASCGDLRQLFDPAHAAEVEHALADLGSIDDIVAGIAADPWGRRARRGEMG